MFKVNLENRGTKGKEGAERTKFRDAEIAKPLNMENEKGVY